MQSLANFDLNFVKLGNENIINYSFGRMDVQTLVILLNEIYKNIIQMNLIYLEIKEAILKTFNTP